MEPLKFVALDKDDLEVVSTHLQDAVVKVADVHLAAAGEPRWCVGARPLRLAARPMRAEPELRRCRSALRFERVAGLQVQARRPRRQGRGAQSAGGRVRGDRRARRRRDADLLRRRRRCGSRSSAWRPSSPISGRPGPAAARPAHLDDVADAPGLTRTRRRAIDRRDRRVPGPGQEGPCRSASTAARPISPSASAPSSPPSGRRRPTSKRPCARSSPMSPPAATRALVELTRKFDRVDLDAVGPARDAPPRSTRPTPPATAARSMRSRSRATASRPITAASCRRTSASPTRSASSSAIAGPRSRRSASTCRAAPPPIRPRC